jgi:acetyltransferase
MADVFDDVAQGLPPLTTTLARRMMERTKIYQALKRGTSGRAAVDLAILERLMVRLSQLVAEQPWVKSVDINPFFVSKKQMAVLDTRINLYPQQTPADQLPRLAIRPYPTHYIDQWTTRGDLAVTIRPIRPEDEPLMVNFHATLSEKSVYLRYFQALNFHQRVSHERLTRLCFIDYDREIALVAEHENKKSGKMEILAVARLTRIPNSDEAEYAGLVSDQYHGQGLGTEMLTRLIKIARQEGIGTILAYTLPENTAMRHIFKREGFHLSREHGVTKAALVLEHTQENV